MRCAARELLARVAYCGCCTKVVQFTKRRGASESCTSNLDKTRLAAQCEPHATPRHAVRPSTVPNDCSEPTPSKPLCQTARQTSCSLLAQGRRRPIPRRA